MFKNAIKEKFNEIVEKTIKKQEKDLGSNVQLILSGNPVQIKVLHNYKPTERDLTVKDLNVPVISPTKVEKKIISALKDLTKEFNLSNARCILLINQGTIVCWLYDGGKPVSQIDVNRLL